ncbi:MAG: hypothetical protein CL583_16700 [Alteromonadaceae bacterium]|nr:hypothetical protein [Alteromonadaceae bacterium]
MVPEGWEASTLGECVSIRSGGTPSKQKPEFWGGDVPWVSAKDLKTHLISDAQDHLTTIGAEHAKMAKPDSVLILVRGMTLLKDVPIGFVTKPVAFNQDLKALVANKNINPKFLSYLLVAKKLQMMGLVNTANHGTGRLDTDLLKGLPVDVPPLTEQRKIADILSTWDAAIEKTEALLATAKAQKRALMQSLLTGERRFPAFKGQPWKEVRLGDVGSISSAGVDKKSEDDQQEVRLLNFLDVFRREFIFDKELNHVVTAPPAKLEQCNVKRGDVFFTPSSETRDEIAISAVAAEDMEGVCYSYHVVRFRLTEAWDLNFRAYVFQTDKFRRQAYKLGDGSGQRYVISQSNFRNMTVRVPTIPEQIKIGAVLRAASDEIGDLEKQIAKLRTEKKALMQQLLTGKRRVVF